MSFNFIEVGSNRERACDFLLVINSNWHTISYRFGVIAAYCSNFGHCVFEPPFGGGLRDNVRCSSWTHWTACSGLLINVKCKNDWWGGATPSTKNGGSKWPCWSEIADFWFVFARSESAVTPSEKRSINTNRKSTTRFPMSPRWTSYVVPKPSPKGWLENAVSQIEQ